MKHIALFLLVLVAGCAARTYETYRFHRPDHIYCSMPKAEVVARIGQILAERSYEITMLDAESGIVQARIDTSVTWSFTVRNDTIRWKASERESRYQRDQYGSPEFDLPRIWYMRSVPFPTLRDPDDTWVTPLIDSLMSMCGTPIDTTRIRE